MLHRITSLLAALLLSACSSTPDINPTAFPYEIERDKLANSEIKLSHRDYGITLGVHFGSGSESNNQYTRATPNVSLRSEVKN